MIASPAARRSVIEGVNVVVRETPTGITVYPSVWKLLAMMLVSELFAFAAYQFLQHPQSAYGVVVSYLGLGLFGLGPLFILGRLLSFRPVLTTSAEGICMDQYLRRAPTHPWKNIAAIAVQKRPSNLIARLLDQRDLIIVFGDTLDIIADAEPNEEKNPNWQRAVRIEAMGQQTIPALYLPMKARHLARLIAQRNASEIARYGIAVRDDAR